MSAPELNNFGRSSVVLREDLSANLHGHPADGEGNENLNVAPGKAHVLSANFVLGNFVNVYRQTRTHTPTPGAGFALVLSRLSSACPQTECGLIKRLEPALDVSRRPVCVPEVTA